MCFRGIELKAVDGSAAEGDGGDAEAGVWCAVSWRGYNLEGGADGQPTIKQLL